MGQISKITIYQEFMMVERSEGSVSGAWKGAHLLLFFLAFVFGSFCTFCFHMLMYMFDEKCVLFPKLLSVKAARHNVIYEFTPSEKDINDMPVDFVSTQWVGQNKCALPTYVPLLSGIFGLVWTTLFLMCSTGSRTLTGLQRPWRVLPPVFIFSLLMGCLCCYTSTVTHSGLHELCLKLGEITGSTTCSYTVNVATLTYERRIRGVYQATRLTILTAWLHTGCWLMSAVLVLVRVFLAIDFQLVRVSATLHGDIDKMLGRHEVHLRTILPETTVTSSDSDLQRKPEGSTDGLFYISRHPTHESTIQDASKVTEAAENKRIIVDFVNDFIDDLPLSGREDTAKKIAHELHENLWEMFNNELDNRGVINELYNSVSDVSSDDSVVYSVQKRSSATNLSQRNRVVSIQEPEPPLTGVGQKIKKSSLKHASVQTNEEQNKKSKQRVQISIKSMDTVDSSSEVSEEVDSVDKETQTQKKEKKD